VFGTQDFRRWDTLVKALFVPGAAVVFVLGVVILCAGIHLLRLRSYKVALAGSIAMIYLGVLTLVFGAGLLFLPGGIWALRVVRKKDIKPVFAK
jgi:cytochrome c biogenesis protein CcdA